MTIKLNRALLLALLGAASTTTLTAHADASHDHMNHGASQGAKTPDCCKNMGKDGACHKMPKGGAKGGHEGHSMGMSAPLPSDAASTRELKVANIKMHKNMDIAYTGDVDVDFLRGMIAHHQGAVDMAQIQLKYGKDAQVKRISQDIIRSQMIEIRWMKTWLAQLEAKDKTITNTPKANGGWTDSKWAGEDDVWLNSR